MGKRQITGLAELRAAQRAGADLLVHVFVFSVFVNLLILTGPIFAMQVYERVLGSRSEETLVALILLVGALYLFMGVFEHVRARLLARFAVRFREALDSRVFRASLQHRALEQETGARAAVGLRQLDAIQAFVISPVMLAAFDILWTPFFIFALFVFHPMLGWLAFFGGGALVLAALLGNLVTNRLTLAAQGESNAAHNLAAKARSSYEIVRSQGMGTTIERRWQALQNTALMQTVYASDRSGSFAAAIKAFRLFLQSAMLALGAFLTLQGELSAGAMIASSILLGRALAPIEQSVGQWPHIQRASQAWHGLGALLQAFPACSARITLPDPPAHLMFHGVSVLAPGTRQPLLSGITFALEPGQILGVIGSSGSGKSTLAKAVIALLPPALGEIRFGGASLDQYGPDQLGRLVGYLPQNITLFNGTVAENIARMSEEIDLKEVFAAAQRANAHDMILALPQGYETVLNCENDLLSGGQKQRIALARALFGHPVLLVLDEPSSALDQAGIDALDQTLRDFRKSARSVIVMSHRPQTIGQCDRLIVLGNGRIRADGLRDEVLSATLINSAQVGREIVRAQQGDDAVGKCNAA
ncbi:type I secretion system permease/ATPase [Planktotalea arctica]|uniref:type I secretion system permease/ATPase n=1 Tax=Planktotalea arctica TaxID=1481893 RepID=UPI00321AF690